MINDIQSAGQSSAMELLRPATPGRPGSAGFLGLLYNLVKNVDGQQAAASQAIKEIAMGQSDNVHNVMLAVAKADLSFRLFLEIRNRLTEAFQEIMRMQV